MSSRLLTGSSIGFDDEDDDETREAFLAKYSKLSSEVHIIITNRVQHVWLHNDFVYYFTSHRRRRDKVLKELHAMTQSVKHFSLLY